MSVLTQEQIAALVERLRQTRKSGPPSWIDMPVNPTGPEAADILEQLAAERDRLKATVKTLHDLDAISVETVQQLTARAEAAEADLEMESEWAVVQPNAHQASDKDKIDQMEDLNWKPAAQYWKEQVEKLQKDLTSVCLDYLAADGQAAENLERALDAEKKLEVYQKVIRSLYPDMSGYYFICGSGGAEDDNGLPERLQVCPAMGVGWSVTYVKTDQTTSVEGL